MAATGCDCRFKDSLGARLSLQELFKPSEYLKFLEAGFSSQNAWPLHSLQCLHESFQSVPNGVKVLDFGAGPVMLSTISAATKASEIVLADYSEANLASLRQWLQNDLQAFDWSPLRRPGARGARRSGNGREGKTSSATRKRRCPLRHYARSSD